MAAYPFPKRLKLTPLFACLVGGGVAIACMTMPADVLEVIVLDSGIPALLPAAAPPLGWTARTAMAMIAGGGALAIAWLAAFLLLNGEGAVTVEAKLPKLPKLSKLPTLPKLPALPVMPRLPNLKALLPQRSPAPLADAVPVLRRSDAHPDAPPRAPLLATRDLGTPFLDVRAEARPPAENDLPRDLDAPLSAFDPDAIPAVPAAPARPVPPLVKRSPAIQQEGERFETFELTPPIAAPRTDATIHALLDRLERGVARNARPATGEVDKALGDLRRLATR